MTDLLPYLLAFVIFLVIVFRDAINRPSLDRDSFTGNDERVKLTLKRLSEARQFMQVEKIELLSKGKTHVPAVNYIAPLKKPSMTVVSIKRTKR